MTNIFTPKNASKFECKKCNFGCSKKCDYQRHLSTAKHKIRTNTIEKTPKNATSCYKCNCGKIYKHISSLWNHKKKCNIEDNIIPDCQEELVVDKDLVLNVLKQNNDLMRENNDFKHMLVETQTQMMELLKNGTHNTNSHNKNFNLNFFLNETCKNAMNIMDFVNSLQLQLSDLEKMGDVGYVNGMSNIIIKNLKDMDVTERPVHCTDMKREVLYVKDEDKWDKETSEKPKIRKAIKYVARKNARLLQEFKEKHPDCNKSESRYSDTYNKLMIEAMGGKGRDEEQESKIIKRLAKETTIDN